MTSRISNCKQFSEKKSFRQNRIRQTDPHRFVLAASQHIHLHENPMPRQGFHDPDFFDLHFRRPDLLRLVGRLQLNV